MLKPYETFVVKSEEKGNIFIKSDKTEVKGVINKGDTISLDLFENENENIAIIRIFKDTPALELEILTTKDILKSKKNARVTKKKIVTNDASLSVKLLNKQNEDFFTDKENIGGYFTSSGTKLIQLFVPKKMMSNVDFSDSCKMLINQLKV